MTPWTAWTAVCQAYHHQFPEFAQMDVHRIGDDIQPSHPLSSPSPPASIFPSIRIFSNESVLHIRWPKYWTFSISPSKEYSELISFRIDWFDLLVVQGTLKSLLQHHSSKASILQLSYPCMTTRKTIALTSSCQQSNVSNFLIHCLGLSQLFFQGGSIF